MAKRSKRAVKGAESLIEEIEKHFKKLETDIKEGNIVRGRYHLKEIDKSLLTALEIKLNILGEKKDIIEYYRKKLEELRKKIEL